MQYAEPATGRKRAPSRPKILRVCHQDRNPNPQGLWITRGSAANAVQWAEAGLRLPANLLTNEAAYLQDLTAGFRAERFIGEWIDFYNTDRPHSALGGATPAEAYGAGQPVDMMDKASALPTSPQAQQQKQDVINKVLAAWS